MTTQTSLFNPSIESSIQIFSPLDPSSENSLDLPTLDFESTVSRQNPFSFQVHRTFAYLADLEKNPISSKDMSLAHTASINTQVQALQVFEKSRQANCSLPFHKFEEELKVSSPPNNLPEVPQLALPSTFTHSMNVYRQSHIEETLATARVVNLFFDEIVEGFIATGQLIKKTYREDCQRKESNQKICKKIEESVEKNLKVVQKLTPFFVEGTQELLLNVIAPSPLLKESFKILTPQVHQQVVMLVENSPQLVPIRNSIRKTGQTIYQFLTKEAIALPQELESQFSIPKKESLKFVSQANNLVITLAGSALFSSVAKVSKAIKVAPKVLRESENLGLQTAAPLASLPKTTPSYVVKSIKTHIPADLSEPKLLARKINRLALAELSFPTLWEIEKKPLSELHHIWSTNNKTLVGLIEQNQIPAFGFHGTGKEGFKGIISSQRSLDPLLWVSGVRHRLDPITHLADIQACLAYSTWFTYLKNGYERGAGLFVLKTEQAFSSGRPIFFLERDFKLSSLSSDSWEERAFLDLITRKKSTVSSYTDPEKIKSFSNIQSKEIINADKLLIHLNEQNYSQTVYGALPVTDALYHPVKFETLSRDSVIKNHLTQRFKLQEITLTAFECLGIIPDVKHVPWDVYQAAGSKLFSQMELVTSLASDKAISLIENFERQSLKNVQSLSGIIKANDLPPDSIVYIAELYKKYK